MNSHDRERIACRWEEVLSELADIDHMLTVPVDPVRREEELLAELAELELELTTVHDKSSDSR